MSAIENQEPRAVGALPRRAFGPVPLIGQGRPGHRPNTSSIAGPSTERDLINPESDIPLPEDRYMSGIRPPALENLNSNPGDEMANQPEDLAEPSQSQRARLNQLSTGNNLPPPAEETAAQPPPASIQPQHLANPSQTPTQLLEAVSPRVANSPGFQAIGFQAQIPQPAQVGQHQTIRLTSFQVLSRRVEVSKQILQVPFQNRNRDARNIASMLHTGRGVITGIAFIFISWGFIIGSLALCVADVLPIGVSAGFAILAESITLTLCTVFTLPDELGFLEVILNIFHSNNLMRFSRILCPVLILYMQTINDIVKIDFMLCMLPLPIGSAIVLLIDLFCRKVVFDKSE